MLDLYTAGDGLTDKARLHRLTELFRPTTVALLDRIDIRPGMSCLDVGCGTASVTLELARRVGPEGRVVGIDIDDARVDDARQEASARNLQNVEFRVSDIRKEREPASEFDVVYSRFVLDHLAKPGEVISIMRDMLRPGGVVIAECTDYSAWHCFPALPAFDRAMELQTELRRRIGGHPEIGLRLPAFFVEAGLRNIEISIFQYMQMTGPLKRWILMALPKDRTDWMVAIDLADKEEIDRLIADLSKHIDDPRTTMGTPRFMQVWGYGSDPEAT